jgi:hypothetical protein
MNSATARLSLPIAGAAGDAWRTRWRTLRARLPAMPWPTFGAARPPQAVTAVMLGRPTLAVRVAAADTGGSRLRLLAAELGDDPGVLARWRSARLFAGSQALLVLRTAERQLLTLDQPQVADGELALAARWPLAEAMDCDAESILATALPLPRINDAQRTQLLAIGARLEPVREQLAACSAAGIDVRSIDIVDSALRGIALLHEPQGQGEQAPASVVLAAAGNDICIGLLWRGAFCALRTLALPSAMPRDAAGFEEHLALHLQRTTDHFERQATQLAVRRVLALLPGIAADARDDVRSMLPLQASWFDPTSAFEVDAAVATRLAAHDDLPALACVAAARLLDRAAPAAAATDTAAAEGAAA